VSEIILKSNPKVQWLTHHDGLHENVLDFCIIPRK